MRSVLALAVAAVAVGSLAQPASATCMERPGPLGTRWVSCAPPGGPVTTWICYRDTCVQLPSLGGGGGGTR